MKSQKWPQIIRMLTMPVPVVSIFEVADYGIQGDIFEIAPAIVAELQKS